MIPPLHEDLIFHGPLSEERADHLVYWLGPLDGKAVVDLGCGWAELLLRVLAAQPGATGYGVDRDADAIEHGRSLAFARRLADRVTLEVGDAGEWSGTADALIVVGSTHVWGGDPVTHTDNALAAGKRLLRPGGRLLLGEGYWLREPSAAQLAAMPIPRDQYGSLAELVDKAVRYGYRPWNIAEASRDEWNEFQSRHALGWERWLAANPDSPEAPEVRARADEHRAQWLRGWHGVLGFAYLTLISP